MSNNNNNKFEFVVLLFRIRSIIEDEGIVALQPLELNADAIAQGVTMDTIVRVPLNYTSKELNVESENDVVSFEGKHYIKIFSKGSQVIIQDLDTDDLLRISEHLLIKKF